MPARHSLKAFRQPRHLHYLHHTQDETKPSRVRNVSPTFSSFILELPSSTLLRFITRFGLAIAGTMLLPAGNTGDIEMHNAPPLSGESTIAPQASQLDPSNTETQHESSLATSNQPSRHSSRRNTRIDYAALDRGELDLRSATPVEISEEQQKETEARRKHEIELQKRRERYAQRKLQLKQEAEASKSNTPEANPTTVSKNFHNLIYW